MNGERAAIVDDTGTNTIKFLLARFAPPDIIEAIATRAETVRLGFEIDKTGTIDSRRVERTIDTLQEFATLGHQHGARELFGVATEALRATTNGPTVLARLREETGWDIEMISGDQEARLTFAGLRSVMQPTGSSLLVDIGGGSTEFVLAVDRTFRSAESLAIGSGRLADRLFSTDPPGLDTVLRARDVALEVMRELSMSILTPGATLYLVGGNGMFLQALSRHFDRGENLDPATLPVLSSDIAMSPSSELSQVLAIPIERARVLPAGAGIAMAVVEKLQPPRIVATESGINRGLLVKRFGLE